MEKEYPKRLLRDGNEPQVGHINNSCRISILTRTKNVLPNEYDIVNGDHVFAHVFAIHENGLGYSARLIHNMMCRQLVTKKKHELWFVFGRKPLRFSMQEFYAVTEFKYKDDFTCDLEKWTDDKGFWSKVLKRGDKITIKKLMDEYLLEACTWEKDVDRIRFVYVCVIVGLVMTKDEKKVTALSYIQLVMDLDKVQTYPWGLLAFDHLVGSIIDSKKKLKNIYSYVLDGFSFALQIWVMEAIPLIGELLGEKIREKLTEVPRCCNWKGAAKLSYDDIITLEDSFGPKDVVYPYISKTENYDVFESVEFLRADEIKDCEVRNLNVLIRSGYDFGDHVWKSVENDDVDDDNIVDVQEDDDVGGENEVPQNEKYVPHTSDEDNQLSGLESSEMTEVANVQVSGLKKRKKKQADHGAETRKRKLLCQRAATTQCYLNEEIKSFIKGVFESAFKSFGESIGTRLGKLEGEVSDLKESISELKNSTTSTPSNLRDVQCKFVVRKK